MGRVGEGWGGLGRGREGWGERYCEEGWVGRESGARKNGWGERVVRGGMGRRESGARREGLRGSKMRNINEQKY